MEKPWDSRFTEIVGQKQYEDFRTAYMAKVRPRLEAKLTCLQDSKKRKTSAVSNNQRATELQCKLVRTVLAKLAKSEGIKRKPKISWNLINREWKTSCQGKTIRKLWNRFEILK